MNLRSSLLLHLVLAGAASAQRVVLPGDSGFMPERVRLGTDTIVILVTPTDSAERLGSTLVRRIARISVDGRPVLRETQRYQNPDGSFSLDTLDVSAQTLAPLRYFTWSASGSGDVRIEGARITGSMGTNGASPQRVDTTASTPFLVSMMDESFIAAYPLHDSASIIVPLGNPPSPAIRRVTFTVTGTETIRTAHGPVECLIVTGPGTTTSWISRRDGRLIRMRWTVPGRATIWKLPPEDAAFR